MQDIHSIGGGSRFFNGGGGDRRLRPQNHQHHQALKCPRCDSLNTKFCYYNNYNLSQPRHFCKACRRYWTKGGVLRNVPVGGGCRKTKRSKPKQTASTTEITTAAATTTAAINTTTPNTRSPSEQQPPQQEQQRERKSSNSHSSSENSSLTAAPGTAAPGTAALEVVSAHSSSSASINLLNSVNDSKMIGNNSLNSNYQGGTVEQGSDCGIFSEIGSLSSLINSANDHLGFGFSNMMNHPGLEPVQQDQNQQWKQKTVKEELKLHESMTGGFIDQTVDVDLSTLQSSRSGNGGGFGTLDWQGTGDQGLFDQTYWNQSQWTDQDQPSLYLP